MLLPLQEKGVIIFLKFLFICSALCNLNDHIGNRTLSRDNFLNALFSHRCPLTIFWLAVQNELRLCLKTCEKLLPEHLWHSRGNISQARNNKEQETRQQKSTIYQDCNRQALSKHVFALAVNDAHLPASSHLHCLQALNPPGEHLFLSAPSLASEVSAFVVTTHSQCDSLSCQYLFSVLFCQQLPASTLYCTLRSQIPQF